MLFDKRQGLAVVADAPFRAPSVSEAEAAYSALVLYAGARDDDDARSSFVALVSNPKKRCEEYRFQGDLGFGGKFRNLGYGIPYVDCYPEHMNDLRKEAIDRTNSALSVIFTHWLRDRG